MMGSKLILWFMVTFQLHLQGEAFPLGPPESSCIDGYPHHANSKLVGPSPYRVWADRASYSPGDIVTVTVSAAAHHTFRGIVVRVHLPEGERLRLLGEFINPPNGTKAVSWYAEQVGMKSCLTHSDSRDRMELSMAWRAPSESHGDIRISVDLVETFERTWADHYIILKGEVEAENTTTFPFEVQEDETGLDKNMHWSECGKERGCVLYPDWCTGSDCDFAVTYRPIRNGQWLEFEVMGGTDDYVAVGFSEDKKMGGTDSGFACIVTKLGEANFLHGLLPAYFFLPHIPIDYRNINVQRINSRIFCRFIRPINITAPYRYLNFNTISDLTLDYHIYLAFGPVYKGTTAIDQHIALPLVSKGKTNLLRPEVIRIGGLTPKIKAHGILNSLAWLGMIGIGSIIARHYKYTFTLTLGGSALWFQVHRALQIIGGLCSVIAIIVIFTIGWTKKAPAHAIIGLVTIGLFLLQAVVALCRPSVDSKRHQIFRTFHHLVALVTVVLAVTNIFLGLMVDVVPPMVTRRCVITVGVILAVYFVWHIVASTLTCKCKDKTDGEKSTPKPKWMRAERASLVVGILGVVAGLLALVIFIALA